MIKKAVLHRILYVGTGLVIVVALILAFKVIPNVKMDTSPQASPDDAVLGILVVIIIHLLIGAALGWTILQRGGRIKKGPLVALGVMLLLLSLILFDGAKAYLDHPDPIMHRVVISIFICIGCNFITSVLTFFAAWYSGRLQQPS